VKRIGMLLMAAIPLFTGCARENAPQLSSTQIPVAVDRNPVSLEQGLAPDTLLVSCFDSQVICVVSTKTAQVVQRLQVLNGPHQLVLDPRSRRAYCLHLRDNALVLLSGNPVRVEQQLGMGGIALAGGTFNPATGDLWICDGLSAVYVLAAGSTVRMREKHQVGRYPHAVAFSPNGNTAFVTLKGENAVAVLDARTGAEKARIAVGIYPQDIVRVGSTLCVSNYSSDDVSLIDMTSLKEKARIPVRRKPHGLEARGKTLWVACEGSYRVMAIDTIQAKLIGSVKLDFYPGAIKVLPHGVLAVADPGHKQVVLVTIKDTQHDE